jgi:hypothetical protein
MATRGGECREVVRAMAADESDEKSPEPDPWADIMADNLGGDSGGDSDDASAFGFLDADNESAVAPSEDEFAPAESAPDANPFAFSTEDVAPPELAAEDFFTAENVTAENAMSEAFAGDDLAGDDLAGGNAGDLVADLFGEPFPTLDDPGASTMNESPVAEEPTAVAPVDHDSFDADTADSFDADTALSEELADELIADATRDVDAPALSVFAPEESAGHEPSPSTIEIGTGLSGLRLDEAEAAAEDAFAAADHAEEAASEADFFGVTAESDDAHAGESSDADPWSGIGAMSTEEPDDSTAADEQSGPGTFDFGGGSADGIAEELAAEDLAAEDLSSAGDFSADAASGDDFSVVGATTAAGAAVAVVGTTAGRTDKPVAPAGRAGRTKKGGIGQILGVVLGGLMAIPIVLGIVIGLMWLGWPDTLGLRKSLPSTLAFLLPPKPPSGLAKLPVVALDGGAAEGGSSLDDVAASAAGLMPGESTGNDSPTTEGDAKPVPTDAFAAAGTLPMPDSPPGLDPALVPDPTMPEGATAPLLAEPAPDAHSLAAAGTRPALPGIDDFDAAVLGEPRPAPEPLDTSALDAAVTAANEAFGAVAGIDDLNDRVGGRQLIDWYRSLARVAEECVRLERVAADSARPLDGAPEQVVDLHARIAADGQLAEQLARLGPMWLAFERRESEGIMLVAEFDGARLVGPWWLSTVFHAGDDGGRHELTVVSRTEPAFPAGEPVFVTGVIFGDDVIWASDCRSARDPRPTTDEASDRPAGGVEDGRPAADDIFSLPEF